MSAIPYPGADVLEQMEMLTDAGFSEEQAKAQIRAIQGVIVAFDTANRRDVATKGDIQDVRNELKSDIQDVRNELKDEIQEVRNELKGEIQEVRNELKGDIQQVRLEIERSRNSILTWMVTLMIGFAGVMLAALAYLK